MSPSELANEALQQERVVLVSSLHHKSSVQPQFPGNTGPLITHYKSLSPRNVEQILSAQILLTVFVLGIWDQQILCNVGPTGS